MTRGRRAKRRLLVALGLLATALFTALGVWQVERRAWKLDLIARVESRIHAPPVPVPARSAWSTVNERDHAYRRVRLQGRFLHDRETLVQALTAQGAGYWVMTPLLTGEGAVLVNRGFVPPDRRDSTTRRAGLIEGPVTVTGLIRTTEPGGTFLRANDEAAGRWFSRDVQAIARARGLPDAAPFFVDADARPNPGGWPLGGLTVVSFRNTHLIYAITWFALAALSAIGVALTLGIGGRR